MKWLWVVGLKAGQRKQFEDVTLCSGRLWWEMFTVVVGQNVGRVKRGATRKFWGSKGSWRPFFCSWLTIIDIPPFNSQIHCFLWSLYEMIYQDICAKDVLTVTESIVITTVTVTEDTTEVWRFTYCSWQHDDVSIRTTHARTVPQATMSKLTTQYITQSFLTFIRASSDHCFQVCAGGSHEGLDYSPVVLVSSVSAASGGRESNSNNLIFCWTLSEKTHRYSTLW